MLSIIFNAVNLSGITNTRFQMDLSVDSVSYELTYDNVL